MQNAQINYSNTQRKNYPEVNVPDMDKMVPTFLCSLIQF